MKAKEELEVVITAENKAKVYNKPTGLIDIEHNRKQIKGACLHGNRINK